VVAEFRREGARVCGDREETQEIGGGSGPGWGRVEQGADGSDDGMGKGLMGEGCAHLIGGAAESGGGGFGPEQGGGVTGWVWLGVGLGGPGGLPHDMGQGGAETSEEVREDRSDGIDDGLLGAARFGGERG